ncbi:MAG: pitrilysin family protein [Candidatus Omnitrophota bacterium]
MTVFLKANHTVPLVNIFLCVRSGSAQEAELAGSGVSHLIEHMVFKGTATRGAGEIFREIESYGATINAFTSYDYTGYTITVPREHTPAALAVLADMLINAAFAPEELVKEKEVVLKEIKMNRDDPERYVNRLLWEMAYTTHPYRLPILGEEQAFAALDRAAIINFYQNAYVPEKMVLSIVGDIDTDQCLPLVREIWGGFSRASAPASAIAVEPEQTTLRTTEVEFTASLTYLTLGYHSVAITDEDLFALDVAATILGAGESSRLYNLLYRQKELVYSIGALNYTPRFSGLFIISALLEESHREEAVALIFDQIAQLQNSLVSADEVEAAKNKIVSDILFSLQTLSDQAQDLALNEVLTNNVRFTETYLENIERVGPEDVQRVAQKYLQQSRLTIAALKPLAKAKSPAERPIRKKFILGLEQLSANEEHNDVKRFTLDNGITLLVSENKDTPLATICAVFQGGLRAEDEKTNGISNLMVKLLDKGTKTRDAEEIARQIESKGAHLSAYSGYNSFLITLDLLSRDLDQMLPLLAQLILNPIFPQHELDRQKEQNLAQIKAQEDNLFESGNLTLKQALFQKHPYRFQPLGNKKSLKRLTRSDISAFYQKYCVGKNMVLAIFGDVNTDTVVAQAREYFATLPAGEKALIFAPKEEKRAVRTATVLMPKQQSLVLMGFPGTTVYSDDKFALEIICQILSQSSGRLFNQIREQNAQAYTLGAHQVTGLDPGSIVIYVATTQENVPTVTETLRAQLAQLAAAPLSAAELAQAKRALVSEKLIGRQTNTARALEGALDELYSLGYDYYRSYAEHINAVDAQTVQRCATTYFDFKNYALVTVGPK